MDEGNVMKRTEELKRVGADSNYASKRILTRSNEGKNFNSN